MGPGEALSLMTFFISVASVIILRGPLGKALADRISGRSSSGDAPTVAEVDRLTADLEDVKHRLAEAEERLDFAERLLAQHKQQSALGPGA